ncbi:MULTISPECIES: hypothetical protein [Pseudoalteromonas]|uniref:Uncharacterized protein n=1 Tax=Pseudoalteromonas luteoviolacea (strain 2ta16) TaxID=1353533 RepID=V4HKV9_PSEL2|nr:MULTISPECIES: hypothetical protein [Pseudoalteromonas]ESP91450.1 hypothetical protein PL2TA16_00249 [Pseudoalteromonas luteoviolacea 2ta16]KZN40100.1 hypothetical protein N483_18095 [Pseudoalteromonas luteoviolacea NCIMB 1944]MCG7551210.1 hypothetical protein [Pseudoalteromonas sp. Of7M-16]
MDKNISELLFRSLGTHALKVLSLSQSELKLVVAPWDDLDNEALATFEVSEIMYFEVTSGEVNAFAQLNLPWDIIRFDSQLVSGLIWEFGLCCDEAHLGFRAKVPDISFSCKAK